MASIAGLLVVLGGGYYLYQASMTRAGLTTAPPQQQIDVVDIRSNLLVIGQAEKLYVVAHGAYGTLDQLRQDGAAALGTEQRGYVFDVTPNGAQSFVATATPTDPAKRGWPTLVITETMEITER